MAYCLDEAVVTFGTGVESILDGVTHKNAKIASAMKQRKLTAILSSAPAEEAKAKQFAPPAATKKRRKAQ